MKQFALAVSTEVHVTDFNPRKEKHGKEKVNAGDVKIRLVVANTILDQLKGPNFRHALYMAPTEVGQPPTEPELEGMPIVTDTPVRRLDGVEPIHLEDELTGYTVTFDIGTGRKESQVELVGCKLNNFVLDLLQGGSVGIEFRIQAAGITRLQYGILCELQDTKVGLLLTPPAEPEQAQLDEDKGAEGGEGGSTRLKNAMRAQDQKDRKAARGKAH